MSSRITLNDRALGLIPAGWKPKKTLTFCFRTVFVDAGRLPRFFTCTTSSYGECPTTVMQRLCDSGCAHV
eukprot:7380086-Prymnesium_polylepis.2